MKQTAIFTNLPIIYNKDIGELSKSSVMSAEAATLLLYLNAVEEKIQTHARNQFLRLKQEIINKYPDAKMEFVQIDNGGNLTLQGRVAKARQGTANGFPDVMLIMSFRGQNMTFFVEFKRIGTPSQIKISEEQKAWNQKLNSMGFLAYITNNPIFFEIEICGKIRGWFDDFI